MVRNFMKVQSVAHPASSDTRSRQGLLDKYKEHLRLAESKTSAGDRIGAENDYQHAEHFFRTAAIKKTEV